MNLSWHNNHIFNLLGHTLLRSNFWLRAQRSPLGGLRTQLLVTGIRSGSIVCKVCALIPYLSIWFIVLFYFVAIIRDM